MTTEIIGYTVIAFAVLMALSRAWKPQYAEWLKLKLVALKPLLQFIVPALMVLGGVLLVKTPTCSLPNFINFKPAVYPEAWVVIIEESSQRDPKLALLLQNWDWRQSLSERDIKFRVYDKDQAEAASYEKLKLKLPAVVFIEPDGKVVHTGACPLDVDAMETLIHEVTGK